MSWSVQMLGKPKNVIAALEIESQKLTGQSKLEFDEALPHIQALVAQTFDNTDESRVPMVKIDCNGSGSAGKKTQGGPMEQLNRNCTIRIETHYVKLV